jgi:hypothetical protein
VAWRARHNAQGVSSSESRIISLPSGPLIFRRYYSLPGSRDSGCDGNRSLNLLSDNQMLQPANLRSADSTNAGRDAGGITRTLYEKPIPKYNYKRRAGVVQWQYRSFPSFGRGFDSHRPLQSNQTVTDDLRCYGCSIWLQLKVSRDLFNWNLACIERGHISGSVSHLLTNHCG